MTNGRWMALAAGVLLVLIMAAYWAQSSATREERDGPYVFTLGGRQMALPVGYFRPPADDGAIELVAFFPGFGPAGRLDDIDATTDLDERFQRLVFLELRPADKKLDPSERVSRLYLRFLEDTSWSHPGGLAARAFEAGSPYEGDELFFTPPDGREFSARCRKGEPGAKTPNTCLAILRADDVDVSLRFSAALLSQWRDLAAGARGLLQSGQR